MNALELNFFLWSIWGLFLLLTLKATSRTKRAEGWWLRLQHILPTVLGFALIFTAPKVSWIAGPIFRGRELAATGNCLTALGISIAIWARIHLGKYWSGIITLKEEHRLIRTGPYSWVRHPLYSGFLLAVFGSSLTAKTGDAIVGFGLLATGIFVKIAREESLLTAEFGEAYLHFKEETSALIPRIY